MSETTPASGGGSAAVVGTTASTPQPSTPVQRPNDPAPQPRPVVSGATQPEPLWFASDSPWNTRVDAAAVDVRSERLLQLASERVGAAESSVGGAPTITRRRVGSGLYINTEAWTVPVVSGGPQTRVTCRQLRCGDSRGITTLPIPADQSPDPRYDGWMTVISGTTAYDLWRARREPDGSVSYQYLRKWDLRGSGYGRPGQVSGRGSGLPLLAGLVRPKELAAGDVRHALAISVPGPATGVYVQPASSTDGNGRVDSIPVGARIRLKSGVRYKAPVDPVTGKRRPMTAAQRRAGDALVAALRRYGAVVVDRSAVPTLYAQKGAVDSMISGGELEGLHLSDFEVVRLGKTYELTARENR